MCIGILNENHLKEIINGPAWNQRANWRNIGINLGIDLGTLDAIQKSKHCAVDDCFIEVIVTWLRSSKPTKGNLDKALLFASANGMSHK